MRKPEQFDDATPLLSDPEALRAKGEADGYLFFKSRIPAAPLLELRRQLLDVIGEHGLLHPDADPAEARADVAEVDAATLVGGCTDPVYADVQRLEAFHRMAHHPDAAGDLRRRCSAPGRSSTRGTSPASCSPADRPARPRRTRTSSTSRVPSRRGPRGSRSTTARASSAACRCSAAATRGACWRSATPRGPGGLATRLCRGEDDWLETDYEVGDVLTFPSVTVHKGLPNQMGDRIRLSCDFRYQSPEAEIEEKSLLPHRDILTWEEIYAGWGEEADDLKYYWRDREMALSPWDESIRWQKDRICD